MTVESKENIHIGFDCPEEFPDVIIDKISEGVKTDGLLFHIRKRPKMGMMAAMEWTIPTVLAAYILKPYFESFLQEMGKDHYTSLKSWLKKQADDSRAIQVRTITAEQAIYKNQKKYSQSKAFSIMFQTKDGRIIKLMFNNDLNKEQWDSAIETLCELVLENYQRYPTDALTQKLAGLKQDARFRIYAAIDKDSGELNFYDDTQITKVKE